MPTTKRKASQFSLASAAIPETPEGLIDGIPAARTLSKGVILNKAVEYIDFLRYSRDAQNEDLETLKSMVRELVGDGAKLVAEFEQRQAERHVDREAERKRLLAEDSQEEQGESGDDDEEEEVPVAQATKGRAGAAGTKRGRPAATAATSVKKARSSTRANGLTPPLSEDYERVQDLNAAHLGALASHEHADHPGVHAFPPSPVSSEDRGVSPSALGSESSRPGRGSRVMLASFMGASFAGGLGYDLAASAAVAEETLAQAAGRAWAGGLIRRSEVSEPTVPAQVTMLHPSLLSGLVALGAACVVVALFYLVRSIVNLGNSNNSPTKSRRSRAMAALQVISARPTATYGAARKNALDARRALLRLVGGPNAFILPFAIAKEAVVWAIRRVTGLTWGRDGPVDEQVTIEEAMAWIRIAEIETMVGKSIKSSISYSAASVITLLKFPPAQAGKSRISLAHTPSCACRTYRERPPGHMSLRPPHALQSMPSSRCTSFPSDMPAAPKQLGHAWSRGGRSPTRPDTRSSMLRSLPTLTMFANACRRRLGSARASTNPRLPAIPCRCCTWPKPLAKLLWRTRGQTRSSRSSQPPPATVSKVSQSRSTRSPTAYTQSVVSSPRGRSYRVSSA